MAYQKSGKVYIVGAGPGDPELLTLKAFKAIQRADAILYDNLINKNILDLAPAGCVVVYVGKKCGHHQMSQEQINETLVEFARRFDNVVRLKGGDPFVFGRGGEEALALMDAQISFEIVPGISSSIAAATYAGIPVTHRNLACSFAVITGHETPGKETSQLNFTALAGIDTLVFMMSVGNRQEISQSLLAAGRNPQDPVVFVENATTLDQKVIRSSLQTVATEPPNVKAPAVMIVGPVGSLNLEWFSEPLYQGSMERVRRGLEATVPQDFGSAGLAQRM